MNLKSLLGIFYLLLAAYIVNSGFLFINLPEIVSSLTKWIMVITGAIIFLESFKYFKSDQKTSLSQ